MQHEHRQKLLELFQDYPGSLIYLEGGRVIHRYNTDFAYPFRQESNFLYLTGVDEPDFRMLLDPGDGSYRLFVPRRDALYAVWAGYVYSLEEYRQYYRPDHIHYVEDLESVLASRKPDSIYCLDRQQAETVEQHGYTADDNFLKDALAYCRSIKTEKEIKRMRKASEYADRAHRTLIENIRPGMKEFELAALFEYTHKSYGLIHPPYDGIFATGRNSAILHYTDNRDELKKGDLFLVDAGVEYDGYASDVTRTYPVDGNWTGLQADLYDIVLQAQKNAIDRVQPGANFEDLHIGACRDIMDGARQIGLVKGSVDALMENNIFALFFPHGLGHLIGLDTHDVGGYPKGVEPSDRPGLKFLRARRTLQPGMALTIEPGFYFIPALLKPALEDASQSGFLDAGRLQTLFDFGGIRIEDDVIVTESGCENLTNVPKERAELESIIRANSL